jgi:hypothetical protein
MKLKQRILKGITNSELAIGNDLSLHHVIGSPFYLGNLDSIKNLFTQEELTLIPDDEEQLPDLIIPDAISLEHFIKSNQK